MFSYFKYQSKSLACWDSSWLLPRVALPLACSDESDLNSLPICLNQSVNAIKFNHFETNIAKISTMGRALPSWVQLQRDHPIRCVLHAWRLSAFRSPFAALSSSPPTPNYCLIRSKIQQHIIKDRWDFIGHLFFVLHQS